MGEWVGSAGMSTDRWRLMSKWLSTAEYPQRQDDRLSKVGSAAEAKGKLISGKGNPSALKKGLLRHTR